MPPMVIRISACRVHLWLFYRGADELLSCTATLMSSSFDRHGQSAQGRTAQGWNHQSPHIQPPALGLMAKPEVLPREGAGQAVTEPGLPADSPPWHW
jgi:hypothetical protein